MTQKKVALKQIHRFLTLLSLTALAASVSVRAEDAPPAFSIEDGASFCSEDLPGNTLSVRWGDSSIVNHDGSRVLGDSFDPLPVSIGLDTAAGFQLLGKIEARRYKVFHNDPQYGFILIGRSADGNVDVLITSKKGSSKTLMNLQIVTPQKTIRRNQVAVECGGTLRS